MRTQIHRGASAIDLKENQFTRMLAKGRLLTTYEAGTQLRRSGIVEESEKTGGMGTIQEVCSQTLSPEPNGSSIFESGSHIPIESDFLGLASEGDGVVSATA